MNFIKFVLTDTFKDLFHGNGNGNGNGIWKAFSKHTQQAAQV